MCSIRKNNNMEGWHINLSSRVSSRGPVPFYLLLTEMFKEAYDLPMTLRLVTESKLRRYQRRKTNGTTTGKKMVGRDLTVTIPLPEIKQSTMSLPCLPSLVTAQFALRYQP
jgi:hypothetical protein